MNPARSRQLVAFLASLGLDPRAAGGPGVSAEALAPIETALTHTSAQGATNHERLEFLGDAVLRLAASEYLRRRHPRLSVGRHSALRSQLVSDRWLAELGHSCGLEAVWVIGPMAQGDRAGLATVRAELSEALIGAIYLSWGESLQPVHTWLTPHWERSCRELLADPDRYNWKSALQEWSQGQELGLPVYVCEEVSQVHADPRRFVSRVAFGSEAWGQGWGRSRRAAEQDAARQALERIRSAPGS